tara:strand:- start:664 stop:1767 length:1104 start_codon:yes stop_codon:yes gene_type:complete
MLNKIKSKTRQSKKTKQSVVSKGTVRSVESEDRYYPSRRLMVCRDCGDEKVSDQTEKFVWDPVQELDVPVAPRCPACNSYKMDWPAEKDGSRPDAVNEDRVLSQKKSYLIKNNTDDYPDMESVSDTEIIYKDDSHTIEPSEGFDSSGIVEKEMYHKGNIHETVYINFVNPGNTPHMQKKVPIAQLIAIKNSQAKASMHLWEDKTYGNSSTNKEVKLKMGFTLECDNHTGARRLSDQEAKRALNNIFFGKEWLKKNSPKEGEWLSYKERDELENKEMEVERNVAVLRTGLKNIGVQAPVYDSRDNLYDTVDPAKLALETDVPWADIKALDLYKMFKDSKKRKAKLRKEAKLKLAETKLKEWETAQIAN